MNPSFSESPGRSRFFCPESRQCGYRCNGEIDCQLGEDERDCPQTEINPQPCSVDELKAGALECRNSKGQLACVPLGWQCDGEIDCGESGEDESLELCGKDHLAQHPCRTGVFCSGECMTHHVCDGVQDDKCPNGEDEKYCGVDYCQEEEFPCMSEESVAFSDSRRPKCIPFSQVCDGPRDCHGGEDEDAQLCEFVKCTDDNLHCFDRSGNYKSCHNTENASNATLLCDGKFDCKSGSDEAQCVDSGIPSLAWYDQFTGNVDCYRQEGEKFVPRLSRDKLSSDDVKLVSNDYPVCKQLDSSSEPSTINTVTAQFTLFQSIDPCEMGQDTCEQLCLSTEPKVSLDEIRFSFSSQIFTLFLARCLPVEKF